MKKVAILVDAGSYEYSFGKQRPHLTLKDVLPPLSQLLENNEELFRIYYYDCPPHKSEEKLPISRQTFNFKKTPVYSKKSLLQKNVSHSPDVAFRKGRLMFTGWELKERVINEIKSKPRKLTDDDFKPNLQQKGTDIKIGLDIAWLASKRIVDAIILVTEDTDFIPAMKFARKEGLRVIYATNKSPQQLFLPHVDEVRTLGIKKSR